MESDAKSIAMQRVHYLESELSKAESRIITLKSKGSEETSTVIRKQLQGTFIWDRMMQEEQFI
jgi:hypothetical protein